MRGSRDAPSTHPALQTPAPPRSCRQSRSLALRALEDALEPFAGCLVVISHDRWLLDRIATHILAFEGESKVTFFDGTARRMAGGRDAGAATGVGSGTNEQQPRASWQTSWPWCARNLTEFEEWRKEQLGDAATRPHRITYGRLTR